MKRVLYLTVLLFFFSCSNFNKRSPQSSKNCYELIDHVSYLGSDNYVKNLHPHEIRDEIKENLTLASDLFDRAGIEYEFKRYFNGKEQYDLVEIYEHGSDDFSKLLRRVKRVNPDLRVIYSPDFDDGSAYAAFDPSINAIIIGQDMMIPVLKGEKFKYVSDFFHEVRHAQFFKKHKEGIDMSYGATVTRIKGDIENPYYDEYLSIEESYTYRKQVQSFSARVKRLRRKSLTHTEEYVELLDALDLSAYLGEVLSLRVVRNLKEALKITPKFSIHESYGDPRGWALRYDIESGNKKLELFLKIDTTKDKNVGLSEKEKMRALKKGRDFLEAQLKLVEKDLNYYKTQRRFLNQVNRELEKLR